jgi:trimeric autotransporter adhesin
MAMTKRGAAFAACIILVLACIVACDTSPSGGATAPEINVQQGSTGLPSGSGSYDFGSMVADGNDGTASSYVTFTIQNLGTADLTVSSVSVSGSDFDKTDTAPYTISSSASSTFTVRFDPLAAGGRSATVTISSNDGDENPYTFAVTGTGTSSPGVPDINIRQGSTQLPSDGMIPYNFGSVTADGNDGIASAWVEFTIENLGTGPLTLSSFQLSWYDVDPPYDRTGPTLGTIAAGASVTFSVRFDPYTTGTKAGWVVVGSNDPDEDSYYFDITGKGI